MSSESSNQTDESTYSYPDLKNHSEEELKRHQALSLDRIDHNLDHLVQFLVHQAGVAAPITPGQVLGERQATVTNPPSEMPVAANNDVVSLGDGRSVPTAVIRALDEYDTATWPGALLPEARAAIAHVVINVIEADKEPVLRTNYPFCLDPNPANLSYESPCVLKAGHPLKHKDNNDGEWM